MKSLFEFLVKKNRITQWLVITWVGIICVVGMCQDFFTSDQVMQIVAYGLLGTLGLGAVGKKD